MAKQFQFTSLAVAIALTLAACSSQVSTTPPGDLALSPAAGDGFVPNNGAGFVPNNGASLQVPGAFRAPVEGIVRIPSALVAAGGMNLATNANQNLVAAGGMNLVAAGGMNLVAAGGMNLVAAGGMNYRIAQIESTTAAGVTIFLADAAGKAIPGLPAVTTNASGHYTIPDVPNGFTLVVNAAIPFANGSTAILSSLTYTGNKGATDVDAGTTITAIRAMQGRTTADMGDFDRVTYRGAADEVLGLINAATVPDFRDIESVAKRALALEESSAALRAKFEQLRAELKLKGNPVATLNEQLAKEPVAAPGPAASDAPVAVAPTTKPVPTAAPTDAPVTVAPTPVPWNLAITGACSTPVEHVFQTKGNLTGASLVFRGPNGNDTNRVSWPVAASVAFDVGATTRPVMVPEGCTMLVELRTIDNKVVASQDNYSLAVGSARTIILPF